MERLFCLQDKTCLHVLMTRMVESEVCHDPIYSKRRSSHTPDNPDLVPSGDACRSPFFLPRLHPDKVAVFFFPFSFRLHAGFVGLFAKKKVQTARNGRVNRSELNRLPDWEGLVADGTRPSHTAHASGSHIVRSYR